MLTTKSLLACLFFWRFFKQKKTKSHVLRYYKDHPTNDEDILMALDYIEGHPHYSTNSRIKTFPYPFSDRYNPQAISMQKDDSNGLFYVMRNGKKLYFRRNITYKKALKLYNSLLVEQDKESSHLYLTDGFNVTTGDVLVDIGCAEGFLALDVIERVKKVYLFEYEDTWIEALHYTFAPWKEKVVIVKKYVADRTEKGCVALDDFFIEKEEKPTFIKMDVEGAELHVLHGMKGLIDSNSSLKLAICTYHKPDDYQQITAFITHAGLNYTPSEGYMLLNGIPYFRKGLIRVTK